MGKVLEIDKDNSERRELSTCFMLLEVENSKTIPKEVVVRVSDGTYKIQVRESMWRTRRRKKVVGGRRNRGEWRC